MYGKCDRARNRTDAEEALQNTLDDPDSLPPTREQLSRARWAPNPKAIREAMELTQEAFAQRRDASTPCRLY